MREKIEMFCEEIKNDFCSFLYHKKISFPYCCRHSADLVTSYLRMLYGDNFKYIGTTNPQIYNHAWTEYFDPEIEEHFIVDFTEFQHTDCDVAVRLKENKLEQSALEEFIKTQKVVYNPSEVYMYGIEDVTKPVIHECYGMDESKKWELSKCDFMEYVKINFAKVHEKTEYL